MKKHALLLEAMIVCAAASAATPQQQYIDRWASTAVGEMTRSGVPASITLAQGLLESDSGQSELASSSNNHFGIKCHSDWQGRSVLHRAESGLECFRAYSKAEESFRDHSDFLRYQDRYKALFSLDPTDYRSWAKGLKQSGYATDPKYPEKLIKVIEDYNLYMYDVGSAGDVPRSPAVLEAPQPEDIHYKEEHLFSISRPVYTVNGVPCIYAIEGETYESIASGKGLFRGEILRYNDLASDAPLATGDIVFLGFKKNRTVRGVDKYIVGDDGHTTLYDVSQRFGVKLKALKRMNRDLGDGVLSEGVTVLLRNAR